VFLRVGDGAALVTFINFRSPREWVSGVACLIGFEDLCTLMRDPSLDLISIRGTEHRF
jgi:hypothetical protein